jgi:hypothetical protein
VKTYKIKKVLLACYGGGHVQSLIPLAHKIQQLSYIDLTIIGFTTAKAAFERAGLAAHGYDCLLEGGDEYWLKLAADQMPEVEHPDIANGDALAYHALGLRDLVLKYGEQDALNRYAKDGRKSFLPEYTFTRFLEKHDFDLVITSTCPRSELALQYAASRIGVTALAVSDLFLQHESSYICGPDYAKHVTVMARFVADFLLEKGYEGELYVTGNPAFDSLGKSVNEVGRETLRQRLGIKDHERLILWVCPSGSISMVGKPFVKPSVMIDFLERVCGKHANMRYMIRQHPSNPIIRDEQFIEKGVICPASVSIESCLSAADQVLIETSTVGLQAALLGLPVVTVGAGDYPPYAKLGLAVDVEGLDAAEEALMQSSKPKLDLLSYPSVGTATDNVMEIIQMLLHRA